MLGIGGRLRLIYKPWHTYTIMDRGYAISRDADIAIHIVLMALAMVILVYLLNFLNFDLAQGFSAGGIIFASFAGSAFLLFMMPEVEVSRMTKFVKAYVIAGLSGYLGYVMVPYIGLYAATAIVVAIAGGLLMATHSRHPPAMGIAFAFVLYRTGQAEVLVVIIGALLLIALKVVLEKTAYLNRDRMRRHRA